MRRMKDNLKLLLNYNVKSPLSNLQLEFTLIRNKRITLQDEVANTFLKNSAKFLVFLLWFLKQNKHDHYFFLV